MAVIPAKAEMTGCKQLSSCDGSVLRSANAEPPTLSTGCTPNRQHRLPDHPQTIVGRKSPAPFPDYDNNQRNDRAV
jgi:hypothetical protein